MTPLLQVRGIRKSFGGVEVLQGINLDAAEGRVLALLGENGAGKSTLVKIISGDYQPSAGQLIWDGTTYDQLTPITAQALGIRMIYQEINDAPTLSVAENIFLGRLPRTAGFVRWREVRARAREILEDLEVDIDPAAPMSSLRIGERQVVEIARALTGEARLLILDEPTAALSNEEVQRLFHFVRRLRDRGTALIYITHRLDELRQVADEVAVLRDGNLVLQGEVADLTRSQMVEAMVGAPIAEVGRPEIAEVAEATPPALRLRGASSGKYFTDVDLTVRPGEVVALYGKVGSGIAEVAEAVFGTRKLTSGEIELPDGPGPRSPSEAVRRGIGLLPADRKREGAFLALSTAQNLVAPTWGAKGHGRFIAKRGEEATAFGTWRDALRIRVGAAGANQPLLTLSGGNQQKVLLARWLHAGSHLLLLVEPTRGVDVGARQEIYATVRRLAAQGLAVLVATSDYEEVVQLADRAIVMAAGRVSRELAPENVNTNALTDAAAG